MRTWERIPTTRPGSACETTMSRRTAVIDPGSAGAAAGRSRSQRAAGRRLPRLIFGRWWPGRARGSGPARAARAGPALRLQDRFPDADRPTAPAGPRAPVAPDRRAQRLAERTRARRGASAAAPGGNLIGGGQSGQGQERESRRSEAQGQKDRAIPEGVSPALLPREGPEPVHPGGQAGEVLRGLRDAPRASERLRAAPINP